jgi:hypothetical protein
VPFADIVQQFTAMAGSPDPIPTAHEMLTGALLLTENRELQLVMAHTIVKYRDPVDRIRMYNWFVARSSGSSWTGDNGDAISLCTWPLFPVDKVIPAPESMRMKNVLLLGPIMENIKSVKGAGANVNHKNIKQEVPRVYKAPGIDGGGYMAPVIINPSTGQPFANLTEVEAAFDALSRTVDSLKKEVSSLRSRLRDHAPQGRNTSTTSNDATPGATPGSPATNSFSKRPGGKSSGGRRFPHGGDSSGTAENP